MGDKPERRGAKVIVSDDSQVQAHYDECIRNGCTDKLARVLAFGKPPRFVDRYSPMHPRRNRGRGY